MLAGRFMGLLWGTSMRRQEHLFLIMDILLHVYSVLIARSNFDMELYLSDIMDGEVCAERYSDYSTCAYGSSCYDRHGRL
jgi:hypothetical protein